MPNIAEFKKIFKVTPINQSLLLIGVHGIGKSEIVKQIAEEDGYAVITFYLGNLSDAGDLIGLPDRTEVEFKYNGQVVRQKITEFCPPKWWPRDSEAKILIFLDEFNRGKAEVYQCIFQMILCRELNGLSLPIHTRIIAAMNPIGDDYNYDVQELDEALYDRFNVYWLEPTVDEWLDYAVKKKFHKYVIAFISKNQSYLDPPKLAKEKKSGEVYQSRRSWERVSQIIIVNKGIEKEEDGNFLKTVMFGIVGMGTTGKFSHFLKEVVTSLSGAKIVTRYDNDVKLQVRMMDSQDIVHLNKEVTIYLETQEQTLFDASSPTETEQYCRNVYNYLMTIAPELCAEFFTLTQIANNEGKTWQVKLLDYKPLVNIFMNFIHNELDEHYKNVDSIILDSENDKSPIDPEHFDYPINDKQGENFGDPIAPNESSGDDSNKFFEQLSNGTGNMYDLPDNEPDDIPKSSSDIDTDIDDLLNSIQ